MIVWASVVAAGVAALISIAIWAISSVKEISAWVHRHRDQPRPRALDPEHDVGSYGRPRPLDPDDNGSDWML